jgi:hypothetical protein
MLLKVYGGIELSNEFIVPILLECQYISQVLGCASYIDSIEDKIMLVFHVNPINPLRVCHWFSLGNDHYLIEVLIKKRVKSVIIDIPRQCASIDLSLFPHRLGLALVANLLPLCRVLRHPKHKSSHVNK